ncbi:CPBP family intramembrane glutamic endopeptidase [Paenibacillus crassostreae]|uniref:Abortive infection protein n=1 Tax=Paenibacillus crassostreae TaxID=1763538 RepID=A0A162KV58_9BACL|nr:CPBP family intramembrane glutamic endopeptidase [Paenibacillus crassostreae]AOZ91397.1 CAAX protease family protein [Paenibacillus crassostreae]OAB74443.1 abortive infection protein [Paenibacillus crassostreae]
MKKIKLKFPKIKIKQVTVNQLNDRLLLLNLYITQALTLVIGIIWLLFQKRNIFDLFSLQNNDNFVAWGMGLAGCMLIIDFFLSKIMPEDSMDDGGINHMLFGKRPVWHIICIAAIVAICEELLFRGAIQYAIGPYWTSIIFAVIHIRYLKHWIPTGWVFLSSYGLGTIYILSGTLWAPILCHFIIDVISGMMIRFRREE